MHIHGGNYDAFYASLGCFRKLLVRRFLLSAESIVLLSERLVPMMKFEPRVAPAICVVPNGVATPDALTGVSGGWPEVPFKVLFLSNLIESKGYLTVLRAAGVVQSRLGKGSVEFLFAGQVMLNPPDDMEVHSEDQAEELIATLVADLDIGASVKFLGVVQGQEKWKLLGTSNLLVLPTRYNNEGQPICILEAMAHGLPVISTNYRAIPDMVIDGQTGFLTPHDDFVALADAIVALVCDSDLYNRLSSNALEHVRKSFAVASYVDSVRKVILKSGGQA
ncbi:hypothetical protein CO641_12055 [Lysobacteraceae bacterium NML91-0213]|nr:hypothetical protein CO641_12055 [Xanthomonadaceae bacterium NML91-0213]